MFFKFLRIFANLFSVYECSHCLYVGGLYMYVPCASEGQKKAQASLELDIMVVVNHHVGTWN